MKDTNKTRAQLIEELSLLRQQLAARPPVASHHEQTQATLLSLASVVQASIDSIVLADLTGKILDVNEATLKMYGTTDKGDLLGKNTLELIAPADRQRAMAYFQEVLARGFLKGREYQVLLKSGATLPVEMSAALLKDAAGAPIGLVGISRDISERKRMEEALWRSEQELADFFENATIGLHWVGPDGTILRVNQAELDLLGYTREEYVGHHIAEFHADPPEIADMLQRLSDGQTLHNYEARLRCKDGALKTVLVDSNVLWERERFVHTRCFTRDITERKQAEVAAQQEAHITAALAQVGRELIGSFDTRALLQRLCELITEVLKSDCSHALLWQSHTGGYMPMASHGHTPEQWEALRTLTVSAAFLNDLLAQREPEEVVSVEVATLPSLPLGVFARQAGLTYLLVTPLRRGTRIVGLLTAAYREHPARFTPQEVRMLRGTGRLASVALEKAQLLDELQQANQAKSEFLAAMSHELRTPLNVVIGYTDLLLEESFGPVTAKQHAALQRVRHAACQEVELITTLLDLSRLEAGRVRLTAAAVDMAELLAELRQETEHGKRKPGLHFEWRAAPDIPPLWTDRFQLKVILTNLIGNAVKFTAQGRILVTVSPAEGGVEWRVTDTGSGITPEVQAVMFEMFRQGESAPTRHYEGVGLGLYIVKRLLELLHGTIVVESAVGKGSTFRVWLPHGSHRISERGETGPALGLQPRGAEGQTGKEH